MAEVVDNRSNSFELFGIDFAVDADLKLWLIEANMSPACKERTAWLSEMLDDMSDGVVRMISTKFNNLGLTKEQSLSIKSACSQTLWTPASKDSHFYIKREGNTRQKVKIPYN